jgi:hypothetical protein
MPEPIFTQRFGLAPSQMIDDDFPASALPALYWILRDLVERDYVPGWNSVTKELGWVARKTGINFSVEETLTELHWTKVYIFCERVYSKILREKGQWSGGEWIEQASLAQVQEHYQQALNELLAEESIAYEFRDGKFYRPGRHQTQKSLAQGFKVLALPELSSAAAHFRKANAFFSSVLDPDYPNAVKEAVSALESTLKALFPEFASKDFNNILAKLRGTREGQIPPTIVKGMQALYEFRGAATNVAHGGADGGIVSPEVAELVLSLAASYIVFLVNFRDSQGEEIPF